MTRDFSPTELGQELVDDMLTDALRAPSAGFTRGVDLLVFTESDSRERFWRAISDHEWRSNDQRSGGLMAAPLIIVPVANPSAYEERYARSDKAGSSLHGTPASAWPVEYWTVDAAFIAMTLLLIAEDRSLGALFFQLQGNETRLLSEFEVPIGRAVIGAIAIGERRSVQDGTSEPAEGPSRPGRVPVRSRSEMVHHNHW
jgi:nitroreductase